MQKSIQIIEHPAFSFTAGLKTTDPALWFGFGLCAVMLLPVLPVLPWLQTFIHPWRPELALSLLLAAFSVWGYKNKNFSRFLANRPRPEFLAVILPCSLFAVWSACSALYAASTRSVLHHTLVWALYIIFYLFFRYFQEQPTASSVNIAVFSAVVWMVGLPAVFEYYTTGISGGALSIGVRYSKYAEMLNALFPLFLAYTLKLKGKTFWLGAVTVLLTWLFAVCSISRTAVSLYVFGLVAMAGFIFILPRYRHYRLKFAYIFALLVLVPALFQGALFLGSGRGVGLVERVNHQNIQDSTSVRPFFSRIALEMFFARPFTGVGADNFGTEFNKYRRAYAASNPGDTNLAIAEAEMAERAHNEYLQIAAELGIPGILALGGLLAGIGWMFVKAFKRRRRISLATFGALVGIVLFLASSLVTSYSFRLVQNGLAFFVLLALAAKGVMPRSGKTGADINFSPVVLRSVFTAGLVICCLMAAFSASRAAAVWYANDIDDKLPDEANARLERASFIDPENASIYAVRGLQSFLQADYGRAAKHFRTTVDYGRATSIEYSYLASNQILSDDRNSAVATLAEARAVYPYSVFIRTRYAVLLRESGRLKEAEEEFAAAIRIDPVQARTWRMLVEDGAVSASTRAFENRLLPVMDLKPKGGIYAVLAEREVLHPEERTMIKF